MVPRVRKVPGQKVSLLFSFWWNHTRSPENFKGGSVRRSGALRSGALRSGAGVQSPGGSPEGAGTVSFRGLQPSEARLHRAK